MYYLIAAWCLLCMAAMYAFTRTPLGRMCNAVRDNPERAEFVGYSTQMVRFIAFCVSGFFAGVAGGLAAIHYEIVTSSVVGAVPSGFVLLMAYIGGVGLLHRPDHRRGADDGAADLAVRLHRRLAALRRA